MHRGDSVWTLGVYESIVNRNNTGTAESGLAEPLLVQPREPIALCSPDQLGERQEELSSLFLLKSSTVFPE